MKWFDLDDEAVHAPAQAIAAIESDPTRSGEFVLNRDLRVGRRFVLLCVARLLRRTNSGFGRAAPVICSDLRPMIAATRSLNSSTVSTRRCSFSGTAPRCMETLAKSRALQIVGQLPGDRRKLHDLVRQFGLGHPVPASKRKSCSRGRIFGSVLI